MAGYKFRSTLTNINMKIPYGQTFKLLLDIHDVECWNKTGKERFTLPAGLLLKLEHGYNETSTTCMAQDPGRAGEAFEVYPGAYRWIIENQKLGAAIGVKMPKKTADLVGDIIAYENGQATKAQVKRLFKSPVCRHLQGHYSSRCTA